jgi:glycosyltransferase involved in cell wall biosynthesis
MASKLKAAYRVKHVISISNTAFLDPPIKTKNINIRQRLVTIGFLSNIAFEKGVLEFLDLHATARDLGMPLRAKLAGPFNDITTERRVRGRLESLQDIEYVGPRYGAEKEAFFSSIDVLILPTRYANEAEPIVVHEAMKLGVPVIAYGRGCIPELIGKRSGRVVDTADSFIPTALAQILTWFFVPSALEAASKAAAQKFFETYVENEQRLLELLSDLKSNCTMPFSGAVACAD